MKCLTKLLLFIITLPICIYSQNTPIIISPNGGEIFEVASSKLIEWTGILPKDTVTLEYSIDRCSTWMLITEKATNLKYMWKNIPNTISNNCLLRIRRYKNFESGIDNSSEVLFSQGVKAFAASYSPNGRYIVSGDANGVCKIWDVITNSLFGIVKCHKGEIYGINWDKLSSKFISSASDGTTVIYDIFNKKLIGPFQSNGGWSNFADFNPKNCDEFAVGCSDGSIKIWSITNNKIKFNIKGHNGLVHQVSYSPNGNMIASAGYDFKVKIWSSDSASLIASLEKHTHSVYCALWSHDGTKLASSGGSQDLTVKIWDTSNWTLSKSLIGHEGKINSCVWSPNDKQILSADDYDHILKWDVASGILLKDYYGNCGGIYYADWSPFGGRFISAGLNGDVKIWDKDTVTFVEDISDSLWAIIPQSNLPCGTTGFNYINFSNINTLSLLGDVSKSGDSLKLTNANFFNKSAFWHKNKVKIDRGFTIDYSFKITKCDNRNSYDGSLPGADGITLVLQNNSIYEIGGTGGGIGYSGIKKGIAFEIDLFKNEIDFNDSNGNHCAIQYTNGDSLSPSHSKNSIFNNNIILIKQDKDYYVKIDYSQKNTSVTVFLDTINPPKNIVLNDINLDFRKIIDINKDGLCFVGITSATGVAYQEHYIKNFSFCEKNESGVFVDEEDKDLSISNDEVVKEIYIYDNIGRIVNRFYNTSIKRIIKLIDKSNLYFILY